MSGSGRRLWAITHTNSVFLLRELYVALAVIGWCACACVRVYTGLLLDELKVPVS